MQAQTLNFEAEAREVLSLMIHSLYKKREIFLRELVSNASDALDKLRHESLTQPGLCGEDERLAIRIELDKEARTVTVSDNGIGMNRDEIVSNLGTIARSGTKQFLERLREANEEANREGTEGALDLIGQFGVGFYSSFLVADEVEVFTRRAGEEQGLRWASKGEGEFSIEEVELELRGTRIVLHLREPDPESEVEQDPAENFLSEHVIADVVRRYSDFVEYPIEMELGEGDERETKTLNSMRPLWSRSKDEITEEQYAEFYRRIAHDYEEPLSTIHFRAEGTLEYTALLFVPKHAPMDLFDESRGRSSLALYVRRVLITQESEDLLPPWLRFVRGLVDSPDLPLNVSRDVLQQNPQVRTIQKRLVKKLLFSFGEMLDNERERYIQFWDAFGAVLKEGIYYGDDEDNRVSKLCLFKTTYGDDLSTLDEIVARMDGAQDELVYLTGQSSEALAASPHLEAYRARGIEVLLLTDPVDEWVVQRMGTYEGKTLKAADRGALAATDVEKEALEERERECRDLLKELETALEGDVGAVRFSARLKDSPAVLVTEEGGLSPNLERILRRSNQDVPPSPRALELNPDHALIGKLKELHEGDDGKDRVAEYAELLYGQALLAEGSPLKDPVRFSSLVTKLMVGS